MKNEVKMDEDFKYKDEEKKVQLRRKPSVGNQKVGKQVQLACFFPFVLQKLKKVTS